MAAAAPGPPGGRPSNRARARVSTQPRDMSLDHALMEVSGNQHAKGISKAYRQVMRLWAFQAWGASRASAASRPSGDLPPRKACPT